MSAPHRPNVLLWTVLYHCTQLDYSYSWDSHMPVVCLICCFLACIQGSLKDANKCPASCSSSASADYEPAGPWVPAQHSHKLLCFGSNQYSNIGTYREQQWGWILLFSLQREIQKSTESGKAVSNTELPFILWKPRRKCTGILLLQ